jgi:hypothetical protein
MKKLIRFNQGHIPGSICVIEASFTTSESISFGLRVMLQRSKYCVIIADDEISAFSLFLLEQKQGRVMILDDQYLPQISDVCQCQPSFFGNAWQYKCSSK